MPLSLSELNLDLDGIQENAANEIARQLTRDLSRADTGEVKARVQAKIDAALDAEFAPKFDELLENAVVRRTNRYGEPLSEPRPLLESLHKRFEEYLSQKVDEHGRTERGTRTRLEWAATKAADAAMDGAIKAQIERINAVVAEAVVAALDGRLDGIAEAVRKKLK